MLMTSILAPSAASTSCSAACACALKANDPAIPAIILVLISLARGLTANLVWADLCVLQ